MSLYLRYTFLFFAIFLFGCTHNKVQVEAFTSPAESRLILNVPFYPDDESFCGSASLASVMNFYGKSVKLEDVIKAIHRNEVNGALAPDMIAFAKNSGLNAKVYQSSPKELIKLLNDSKPLIVKLHPKKNSVISTQDHFLVVLGYNPNGVVVNTSNIQQEIIPWPEFLTNWLQNNNLTILIEPKAS